MQCVKEAWEAVSIKTNVVSQKTWVVQRMIIYLTLISKIYIPGVIMQELSTIAVSDQV